MMIMTLINQNQKLLLKMLMKIKKMKMKCNKMRNRKIMNNKEFMTKNKTMYNDLYDNRIQKKKLNNDIYFFIYFLCILL